MYGGGGRMGIKAEALIVMTSVAALALRLLLFLIEVLNRLPPPRVGL